MARPKGWFILVISALTSRLKLLPIFTMSLASSSASSLRCMKAPLPYLTSKRIQSQPLANFLLMIEEAINGIESTVAVTSLNAYSFLSAGSIDLLWPIMAIPFFVTRSINSWGLISILIPGIASNLSKVPPVKPNPRPDILATFTPKAAIIGQRARLVLSPTPPVECLSHFTPGILLRFISSPEFIIASVKANVSFSVMPQRRIAIKRAVVW